MFGLSWPGSRRRRNDVARSRPTRLERAPDACSQRTLDGVSKNVVPHAEVISSPPDDSGPRERGEEPPARPSSSRPGYAPCDDTGEGSQKRLKCPTPPRANEQVQVRPHVGKVIDADSETLRQRAQHAAHRLVVFAKGPRPARPLAHENDVHGATGADRSLELATPAPARSAVLGPKELGAHVGREEVALHDS